MATEFNYGIRIIGYGNVKISSFPLERDIYQGFVHKKTLLY